MGFCDDPRAKGTAYDDCHVLSPVRAGCRTNIRRPWPDVRASNGGTFSLAWGRAGRPQAADVLSQPGGMDELQAFLSLLAASTGTCWPESAIWRSGVMISTGTPSLSALETSPESTFLS